MPLIAFLLALALLLAAIPVTAAEQRYAPWSDADAQAAETGRLQEFVDKLNKLVDEAETARAADPRLLLDLRDLARAYNRPWRVRLVADDFVDGDYTRNPVWTVGSGEFWVERGWGLRSRLKAAAAPSPAPAQESRRVKGSDVAIALLGQILGQGSRQQGGGTTTRPVAAAAPVDNVIHTAVALTNAFLIELDVSSWVGAGRFEAGPYQGDQSRVGYRVVYAPGGPIRLTRVGSRGSSVIDSAPGPFTLEDQTVHRLVWARHADGGMTVSLDGKEILSAVDRAFGDTFDGLVVANRGADVIVKRIAAYGTQ